MPTINDHGIILLEKEFNKKRQFSIHVENINDRKSCIFLDHAIIGASTRTGPVTGWYCHDFIAFLSRWRLLA